MRSSKKYLHKQDLFSHQVEFNIDQTGKAHGTTAGGCISILLKIVYFLYLFSLV